MIAASVVPPRGLAASGLRYSERVDGTSSVNTVVGLLGLADTRHFGDSISPRISIQELTHRLPHVEFRLLAPFGWEHPLAANGGVVIEPLGAPTAARRAELADQLDALIIGGGEIIHDRDHLFAARYSLPETRLSKSPDAVAALSPGRWFIEGVGKNSELRCPTMWNGVGVPFALTGNLGDTVRTSLSQRAYVSVRDERSMARLRTAGADGDIALVPDPGFLVPRLLSPRTLQRRRALHHLLNWLPTCSYVLIQGNSSLLPLVGQISAALDSALGNTDLAVVALDTTPSIGDTSFVDALRRQCPLAVHIMPSELSNEDIAAVIEGAKAAVAVSLHTSVTAMAFEVPTVILNIGDQSRLTALAELTGPACELITDLGDLPAALRKALVTTGAGQLVRSLQAELDVHFDRMDEIIEQAGSAGAVGPVRTQRRAAVVAQELRALRRAHSVRSRQLVFERSAFAAAFENQIAVADDVQARFVAVREAMEVLQSELADVRHHHALAVQRINELDAALAVERANRDELLQRASAERDELLNLARAERDALATRSIDQVNHLESEVDAMTQHAHVLRSQLVVTETALAEVHRTKTFRLARVPRRVFGWLKQ